MCRGLVLLLPAQSAWSAAIDLRSDEDLSGVLLSLLSSMNFP